MRRWVRRTFMTSSKSELLLCTGFIFIAGGIMLIAFLFSDAPTSFFFIFPFFYVGNLESIGVLFLAVSIVMIGVFIFQVFRFTRHFDSGGSDEQTPTFYGECFLCKSDVPSDAEYCPKCGTKLKESLGDGQSQ